MNLLYFWCHDACCLLVIVVVSYSYRYAYWHAIVLNLVSIVRVIMLIMPFWFDIYVLTRSQMILTPLPLPLHDFSRFHPSVCSHFYDSSYFSDLIISLLSCVCTLSFLIIHNGKYYEPLKRQPQSFRAAEQPQASVSYRAVYRRFQNWREQACGRLPTERLLGTVLSRQSGKPYRKSSLPHRF